MRKHSCINDHKSLIVVDDSFEEKKIQNCLNYLLIKIIVNDDRTFNLFESEDFKMLFKIFLSELEYLHIIQLKFI
jgi:hypothetical protein